jgi:DNA-directed RNA polymerase specialized sigma24 family protein
MSGCFLCAIASFSLKHCGYALQRRASLSSLNVKTSFALRLFLPCECERKLLFTNLLDLTHYPTHKIYSEEKFAKCVYNFHKTFFTMGAESFLHERRLLKYTTPMNHLFNKNYVEMTDEELMKGTARGNDKQYAELMRRYMRAVYSFVCQYAAPEDAVHITEQTFYTFWKSVHRFDSRRKSRRWLFTIAKNLATTSLEERYFLPARTLEIPLPRGRALQIERISLLEVVDKLRARLAELSVLHHTIRLWALPRLSTLYRTLQNRLRLQNRFKTRLSFNTYRI